jgi:5-methyltetrahydropteroyltriglutamate--homocysteine methyltransferase
MRVLTKSSGSYPRVGEGDYALRLRRAHNQRDKGQITDEQFAAIQDDYVREVIAEQIDAGLDVVTDGQIRWHDHISHQMRGLSNVKIGALHRFADTNYLVRRPIVTGRITHVRAVVAPEYEFARKHSSRPVLPVVTGPLTMAAYSDVECDYAFDALVGDLAATVAEEVAALARAGAARCQIDEPQLLVEPEKFDFVEASLNTIAAKAPNVALELLTYFGDATPLYDRLQSLPVDVLGLDFTYSPRLVEVVSTSGSAKGLGLGLIDGRNTMLETPERVIAAARKMLGKIKGEAVYLNPSCGLEYLPRDRALRKLKNMVAIARQLNGEASA